MSLPNWKSIPVCIRRSRRKLYNLVATEFSLTSYDSLDVSVRRSNRKLYNYVASQLNLVSYDELDVPLRRSTHLLYNYVKDCSSTQTLTITVTDEDSVAISGASVVIGETSKSTGDDGKVEFSLTYGDYSATISKSGYVTATEELAFRSNHKNFAVELEAETPTLTVTVTDGENAISGATVVIGEDTETTDSDGEATFSLEYDTYTATVSKEGYTTATESITFDSTHTTVTVTLTAAAQTGTVTVTCQDSEQTALEGAIIHLVNGDEENVAGGTTNNSGVAQLFLLDGRTLTDNPNIPFDTYTLEAFSDDDSLSYEGSLTVDSETVTVTITLTSG